MKRFIRTLLIFCVLPLPLLYGLQYIVDEGLKKSNHELFTEWNDIYAGRINADLLVMGSSRAWVHYSPAILDRELHLDSYNLGIDGWSFPMQDARFKIYLKHNRKPEYVIQNLDGYILNRNQDLYNSQQFLPYLSDNDIRNATRGYKGEFGAAQYYFPLFKYNSNQNLVLTGILNYFNLAKVERKKFKGYQGQELAWDNSFDEFKSEHSNGTTLEINDEVDAEFNDYLNFCRENNIKVILVYSPEYIEAQNLTINRREILKHYRDISEKFGLLFLDYSNHPICFDQKYFYNSQHLNREGAELFTKTLAQDLSKLK